MPALSEMEQTLGFTPSGEDTTFFRVELSPTAALPFHGQTFAMIVPAKDEKEAAETYWLRRAAQGHYFETIATPSTVDAYEEQLRKRLGV